WRSGPCVEYSQYERTTTVTTSPDSLEFANALTSARLQVVQPGSRASFRRRVMDALALLVPAPGAFFCFGRDDGRAYNDSSRIVDGAHHPLKKTEGTKLT